MRWGYVECMGKRRVVHRVLVGKRNGKRPLGGRRRKGEHNSKMDLQDVECGEKGWIDLFQERDRWRAPVTAVMNPRVP